MRDPVLSAPATVSASGAAALPGSQAIHRAFLLLRHVARAGSEGERLAELSTATGLTVATAYRLLQALAREGMVEQDRASRRYRLGPGCAQFSDAAGHGNLQARLRPALAKVAAALGCSAYLSLRVGQEALCVDRVTGRNPIQVIPYDIGERRPLGVGAASIAMLAEEPPQRARQIMARHQAAYARYGLATADIAPMVEACREAGYSYNPGHFIRGVAGLGLVLRDARGGMMAAVNIAALSTELARPEQRKAVATLLREAAEAALGEG